MVIDFPSWIAFIDAAFFVVDICKWIGSCLLSFAAEAIEVEDLGAKFRPGSASFGRSAQSRALANLKNRRQQRNLSPQRNEGFDQSRLAGSQEDDTASTETDVVILRDQKVCALLFITCEWKWKVKYPLEGSL